MFAADILPAITVPVTFAFARLAGPLTFKLVMFSVGVFDVVTVSVVTFYVVVVILVVLTLPTVSKFVILS